MSLAAPTTDPLWQEIKTSQQANSGKPITGQLELILPEPEENVVASLPFRLSMDKHPWLIITNAQALSAPVLIPLDKEETKQDLTLSLPAPSESRWLANCYPSNITTRMHNQSQARTSFNSCL